MNRALINVRFLLARLLVGRHAAAINCKAAGLTPGYMAWSSSGRTTFYTKGDPR